VCVDDWRTPLGTQSVHTCAQTVGHVSRAGTEGYAVTATPNGNIGPMEHCHPQQESGRTNATSGIFRILIVMATNSKQTTPPVHSDPNLLN
jgi:hypothetical protein